MSDAHLNTTRQSWTSRVKWFAVAAAVMSVMPSPVLAEEAGSNGIRFGRARVHPFFDFFSYYQTNPGRMTNNSVADVLLTMRPGFNVDYPGRSYELYGTGNFEYRHYMGLNTTGENGEVISANDTTLLSTFMGGLSVDGKLLKTSSFPVNVKAEYTRTDKPANQSQNRTLARNTFGGKLGTDWAPGGGALRLGLGYRPVITDYDGAENDSLDAINHTLTFSTQWRFLPKTATFLEAIYSNYGYRNSDALITIGSVENNTQVTAPNVAVPIASGFWGLSGQITPRISTIFKFGYGVTMKDGDDQAGGFLTQVDLKYKASDTTTYSGGYARTLAGAALFQHMMTNRIYAKGKLALARRYAVAASLEFDMVDYGAVVTDLTRTDLRSDSVVRVELVGSAKITNWFVVSLVNKFEQLSTDYEIIADYGAPSYSYNDTFLRMSVRY